MKMNLLKKLCLPLAVVISLTACTGSKKVDFQTFKDEVAKVDISQRKEIDTVVVNGTMKGSDSETLKWDNKELSEKTVLSMSLGDMAVLLLVGMGSLDQMIKTAEDEAGNEYYIGSTYKLTNNEKDTTIEWYDNLYLKSIDGDYEGSLCHLTFKYYYAAEA